MNQTISKGHSSGSRNNAETIIMKFPSVKFVFLAQKYLQAIFRVHSNKNENMIEWNWLGGLDVKYTIGRVKHLITFSVKHLIILRSRERLRSLSCSSCISRITLDVEWKTEEWRLQRAFHLCYHQYTILKWNTDADARLHANCLTGCIWRGVRGFDPRKR